MAVGNIGPATRGNETRAHAPKPTPFPEPPNGYIVPKRGEVLLAAITADTQALVDLGYGSAGVTGGYGGWVLTPRPKDVALTEWEGGEPIQLTIPFTLGSHRHPDPVRTEMNVTMLERLAGRGGRFRPPACLMHSAGVVPHDFLHAPQNRWVVEDLGWDLGAECRDRRGRRTWVVGDLVLRQYVRDQTLVGLTDATQQNRDERDDNETLPRRVEARKGDTLRKIAKRFDLDRVELRDMKQLNDIRDVDKVLKTGQVIRLPVRRAGTFG